MAAYPGYVFLIIFYLIAKYLNVWWTCKGQDFCYKNILFTDNSSTDELADHLHHDSLTGALIQTVHSCPNVIIPDVYVMIQTHWDVNFSTSFVYTVLIMHQNKTLKIISLSESQHQNKTLKIISLSESHPHVFGSSNSLFLLTFKPFSKVDNQCHLSTY